MKLKESFAVEATKEVRKDKRFDSYVNWLRSLENNQYSDDLYYEFPLIGIDLHFNVENLYYDTSFNEILTLDEVYSRYGKEIYEANGIEWYHVDGMFYHRTGEKMDCTGKDEEVVGFRNPTQEEIDSIKQPFQGSREYDEKLLAEYIYKEFIEGGHCCSVQVEDFLNNRYPNESILKQIAEKEAEIEELKKQLK